MSTSPAKHKSNHHHHHHHHHREHHHSSSSSGGTSGYSSNPIQKSTPNLASLIKIQDNSKLLPHYSLALSKPHDECLPMDELDPIQMELECLLSSVALRYRALKVEYDLLEDRKHQKKKDADKEKANLPSTGGSGKRKRDDKKSSSKESSRYSHTKHSKVKSAASSSSPAQQQKQLHIDQQHTTNTSTNDILPYPNLNASTHSQHTNHHNKLLLPKNDLPNKFWLSVEPYCMPITHEDIKLLDDLIDEYTEPLVAGIPELGPHYAVRWASEDLRDDNDTPKASSKKGSHASAASSTTTATSTSTTTPNTAATNAASVAHEKFMGQGICGPLTQHLISALLDDNTESAQNDIVGGGGGSAGCGDSAMIQDSNDSCTENNASSANRAKASSATIESLWKSGIDVEKRLKKELLDLGIFDASDFAKDKDDEVLNEIKRVRTELQAIAEYNRDELKLLRAAAKEEMKRLEVKRKLDRIDQEIIEAYKRVFEAKQKRRPMSKNERNEIYRLADEQKRLADQLEAMPIPGFNYAVGTTTTTATTATTKITATAAAAATASTTSVTASTATSASNTTKA